MENNTKIINHQFTSIGALKHSFMIFVHDSGIFIPTHEIFHLSDLVTVSITLPENAHHFTFTGEIMWITPNSNPHSGIGVQCNGDEGQAFRLAAQALLKDFKDNGDEQSDTM
ncbi:MAG: hypothetical protein ACD_42C00522G0004 [uncultured bacterium]|nr:MAG: hypothetical protein ACD_42C00522G0004 [uncultured bacterium]OGT34507.1 MAG: hypothetical protein A3C44_08085 [Gammaproteobacteria bacterium RIFCSPHIGHO2_02_FULL_39_13]OGT50568.1 MAG: hypothetical protein A3E53_03500 [Gammaproteobacteria bacterium RIFCSPHIGHO2_12_FULL_39_24]